MFVSDVGSSLSMAIAKLLVLYFVEGLFQHTHRSFLVRIYVLKVVML